MTTQVRIVDSDTRKLQLVKRTRDEGFERTLIYTLPSVTDSKWLDMLRYAWVLETQTPNGETSGWAWFDNQNGASAWCHYMAFESHQSQIIPIGLEVIHWVEDRLKVQTLLGLTPKPYRHSRNIMEAWGFKQCMEVPDGCWLEQHQRSVTGIIYMRRKQEQCNAQSDSHSG